MKKPMRFFLIILLLNLSVRFAFTLAFTGSEGLYADSYHHLVVGRSLYEGRGFETDVVWPLIISSWGYPPNYSYRQPLYPLLLAVSFKILGESLASAFLVNIIAESLIASLLYLLGLYLTSSERIAILSSFFYSFHPLSLAYTTQIFTESVFSLFVCLSFLAMLKFPSRAYTLLFGVFAGLSYMAREQGILLLLMGFIHLLSAGKLRHRIKPAISMLLVFTLIATPWFARNYLLTGNPVYNHFHVLAFMIPKNDNYLFSLLDYQDAGKYAFESRFNSENISLFVLNFINLIVEQAMAFTPNLLLTLIFLLMLPSTRTVFRVNGKVWKTLGAYYLISLFLVCTSFGRARYLYSFLPFFTILLASSFDSFCVRHVFTLADRKQRILYMLLVAVVLMMGVFVAWENKKITDYPDMGSTIRLAEGRIVEKDVVMADYPYYMSYYFRSKAVQIPSRAEDLDEVIKLYNVTHILQSRNWYMNVTETERIRLVGVDGNMTLFLVSKK